MREREREERKESGGAAAAEAAEPLIGRAAFERPLTSFFRLFFFSLSSARKKTSLLLSVFSAPSGFFFPRLSDRSRRRHVGRCRVPDWSSPLWCVFACKRDGKREGEKRKASESKEIESKREKKKGKTPAAPVVLWRIRGPSDTACPSLWIPSSYGSGIAPLCSILWSGKERRKRRRGGARNANRSRAAKATPSGNHGMCGGGTKKREQALFLSLSFSLLARALASASPPTAHAMRRGSLGAVVSDRAATREGPFDAALPCLILFLSLCGAESPPLLVGPPILPPLFSLSLSLVPCSNSLTPLLPSQTPTNPSPLPPRINRPAHAGLAGHGLEDGDRHLRGL